MSTTFTEIVNEQAQREQRKSEPSAGPVVNQWLPFYAMSPREGQRVEWIGEHGESVRGYFANGCWFHANGRKASEPALWRPAYGDGR